MPKLLILQLTVIIYVYIRQDKADRFLKVLNVEGYMLTRQLRRSCKPFAARVFRGDCELIQLSMFVRTVFIPAVSCAFPAVSCAFK